MSDRRERRPDERVSLSGAFALLATALAAATLWVVYDELVVRRPWKRIQADFNRLVETRGGEPVAIGLRQVTNPDLSVIDRCPTCHLGIDRIELSGADVPQPHRAHPRLEQGFLEAHPPRKFGCTICHGGQGSQTKGVAGADFDHGRDDPYWERPLRRGALVESSCPGCHAAEDVAPTFAAGRRLFDDLGCWSCHETPFFDRDEQSFAPPLDLVRAKHDPTSLAEWIRAPHEARPTTRMPDTWPAPTDPEGRPLPGDHPQRREWQRARAQEPVAITAFLGSVEPQTSLREAPAGGDPARGRARYIALGCAACHESTDERIVGPELGGIGEFASARWLDAWLADPRAVWAKATMPNFRLAAEERHDLVAYLTTLREGHAPAAEERATWPVQAQVITAGRRQLQHYGCYGCHAVPGFIGAGRPGPSLHDYGDKPPDLLDWGQVTPTDNEDPLAEWTRIKISDPRRFRRGESSLAMPKYRLSEAETEALTVFVLAHRSRPPRDVRAPVDPRDRIIARGERLIERLGCRGCHEIGRTEDQHLDENGEVLWTDYHPRGGAIRKNYQERYQAPPALTYGGLKLRYQWTFDYLRAPFVVRPWLPGRMPTYGLTIEDTQALVAYLAAVDEQPFPFRDLTVSALSSAELEDGRWLFRKMQCSKCHRPNDPDGDPADLAPDLALARDRLTPAWLRRWLLAPQSMEPGTRMPTLFPRSDDDDPNSYTTPYPERLGGDVHRQVDALIALTIAYATDPRLLHSVDGSSGEQR